MGKPHRTFTPEFKVRVIMELITGKKSLGEASREYGIKDSVISRWRKGKLLVRTGGHPMLTRIVHNSPKFYTLVSFHLNVV